MHTYELKLSHEVSSSFRCQKAANSLDIDTAKNAEHRFEVNADVEQDFNIGLIVGASGSGKTTLAKSIWGDNCFSTLLSEDTPILEQFPEHFTYDECAAMLNGVGLTQVVCWIRPVYTLSNGQRSRAEIALQLANDSDELVVCIDEWTSVVDRTVAKVMSYCIQKHARRSNRKIVLCSCHYDVFEWLNPDWVIDCNKQEYIDRRSLWRDYKRNEQLEFGIRSVGRDTWKYFSKYHYLSERLPGGKIETFGVYCNDDQIGFQCFANYVPFRRGHKKMQMHSNRTVIHPDYAGLGLGIRVINLTSEIMHRRGFDVRAKFSSVPVYKAMKRQACWRFERESRDLKIVVGETMARGGSSSRYRTAREDARGFRLKVRTFSFTYLPQPDLELSL